MVGRRVYVIWSHPLFHESVRLLLHQSKLELVGATSDHAAARSQIIELCPDVVIIEEKNGEDLVNDKTLEILRASPKVIRLSLADNELRVFQLERRTVAKVEDLMSLIIEDSEEGKTE